jgi:ATP/maltotriose-dependent transcriptional regulator MalT/DNA-binding SARP family transcriptional activator
MSITIVNPSILLPRLRTEILPRPRLLNLFSEFLERKLILVVAPAGYGKTSLIVNFAHQQDMPVCWYAVDHYDQELRNFLAHFVASISRVFPGVGFESNAALDRLEKPDSDIELVVNTIVNEIYEYIDEHFVLVLDDFQVVAGNLEISAFINRFVSRVGENCHLVILSRQQPDFPHLELFVARRQVGQIGLKELAFTAPEIRLLAQKYNYQLTDQQIAALVEQTEGWITGILLTPTLSAPTKNSFLRGARSNGASLTTYWDLLLHQQTAALQKLLLYSSPLEEFNADLCRRLFDDEYPSNTDWDTLLDALLRNNLFVQPVGDDLTWLRYHHLFQDYLQARLQRDYPCVTKRILRRLLDVHRDNREWEKAYSLSQQLNDLPITIEIIEQAGPELLKHGRFNLLTNWLESIPPARLSTHPGLLSLRGSIALMSHHLPQGLELLNQAAALQAATDPSGLARTLVRRSAGYQFIGDHSAALKDAEEALKLADRDDRLQGVKAQALKARGVSLHRLDRSTEGIQDIERSLELYIALDDKPNIASLYHEMGMIHFAAGDMPATRGAYLKAMQYWRGENDFYRLCDLLNNLGVLYHQLGEYEQSIAAFDEGLKYARLTGFARSEAYLLASLGDLYADIQAVQEAEEVFEEALLVARRIENRSLCFYVTRALASLACDHNDLPRAQELYDRASGLAQAGACQEQGLLAIGRARLALRNGRLPDAIQDLHAALQNFCVGKLLLEELQAHLYLGAAYLQVDDEENSRAHLKIVFDNISNSNPQHAILIASRFAFPALEYFRKDTLLGRQAARLLAHFSQLDARLPEIRRRLRRNIVEAPLIQPKMIIRAFGAMQVTVLGKTYHSLDWQSRTQRDLLFYLLQTREGATKEALLSRFWCNLEEHGNQLATTLYKMRRIFGDDVILFRNGRYLFNRSLDYEYDVETFLHYWAQARQEVDIPKRLQLLHRMLDLYLGDYAVEAEGSWVVTERERLYQIYVQAVSNLVEQYLEQKEYTVGLDCCLRAMDHDSCQEMFYRLAMQICAEMGDLVGVNHYYRLCQKALERVHGIHPSDETRHLYQELLN